MESTFTNHSTKSKSGSLIELTNKLLVYLRGTQADH